jgi:hypothetical protein
LNDAQLGNIVKHYAMPISFPVQIKFGAEVVHGRPSHPKQANQEFAKEYPLPNTPSKRWILRSCPLVDALALEDSY